MSAEDQPTIQVLQADAPDGSQFVLVRIVLPPREGHPDPDPLDLAFDPDTADSIAVSISTAADRCRGEVH